MKQYTSLKNLSTTAATLTALLLVMPAHSQEDPQPDSENAGSSEAGMGAEGPSQAEQDSSNLQAEDAEPGAQDAGADDAASADAAADSDAAQAADSASAENLGGEEQDTEEQNYEEALRGLTWEQRFQEVDADDNSSAEWNELAQTYERELAEADWSQEEAIQQFDRDQDGRLDQTEYLFFLSSLQQELADNDADQEAQG